MGAYSAGTCHHCHYRLLIRLVLCSIVTLSVPVTAQEELTDHATALIDSAYAHLERGYIDVALNCASAAVDLEPDSARAHSCLGRVYLAIPNRTLRALECFRTALFKYPHNIETLYWKARAHLRLAPTDLGRQNSREALKNLVHLLELDPSHPDASYLCGVIYRDFREDHPAAIDAFRLQVEANPGHHRAQAALIEALIDSGEWNRAIRYAEELIGRDPLENMAFLFLAAAHWKSERNEEAMQTFESFFAIAPEKERDLFFDLGLILPPPEAAGFSVLDDEGKRRYWTNYWRARNPDPKTKVNERLLEHFIRVAYARIRFGENEWPWDGRGPVFIRYGEPEIRSGRDRVYAWSLLDDDPVWMKKRRDLSRELGLGLDDVRIPLAIERTLPLTDLGPLNRIAQQRVRDASGVAISSSFTPENWGYIDRGFIIAFEDFAMSGSYIILNATTKQFMERMELIKPTLSKLEDRIEHIDPMDYIITFRGEDGRTALEYAFALLPDEFGAFRSVTGAYATIDVEVQLFDRKWQPVAESLEPSRRLSTVPQVEVRGVPLFIDATRIEVEPGDYILTTLLIDPESGKRASARELVDLPDYSGNRLMISDILPAAVIREVEPGRTGRFIRGGLEVLPLPGRIMQTDQPLFVYFECYNLKRDEFGSTRYRIEYTVSESTSDDSALKRLYQGLGDLVGIRRREAALSSEYIRTDIQRDLSNYLEIDMSALPHGVYDLAVTITDLLSGQSASSVLTFRTLPPIPDRGFTLRRIPVSPD